ncbi:cell wall-binding repeat-containing protein [Clostridium sp. CX1]|uniref:cell wall-binding repeat-containing protein n=1 Tax=Clostridium sp. CX1 TaxID=2978346 RepID=UPI0021C168B0|nr:cell wall-binding repeat-containing protein [Clostridium sp. CX1]MCT8975001.1 cell wall-binding repeat-containing protein [Clostridium sp. CX1]
MNKLILKFATVLVVSIMCLTNLSNVKADNSSSTTSTNTSVIKKITGSNSFDTSISVSKSGWDKSDSVIIASPADFPDSLSGTILGIQLNAPILFSSADNLTFTLPNGNTYDGALLSEIKRLGAKTVYILGGESSISSLIENTIKSRGYQTVRLSGDDRFKTAIAVGQEVVKKSKSDTAFICNAYGFADALAGSTFAGKSGSPILLTDKATLNKESKKALTDWNIKKIYILGGQGVVSSNVENELSTIGISINRIGGADRYDTAKAIINNFNSSPQSLTVATGKDYHNALVASVYASKENAPLMLFDNDCNSTIKGFLKNKSLIAVGNEDIDLNNYDFSDLPDIEVPNAHEVTYDKRSEAFNKGSALFNYDMYSDQQKYGGQTSMAYWDLTSGEFSGIDIDKPVSMWSEPVLILDLFIYDQRSKGQIDGNEKLFYKRDTNGTKLFKTVAELQRLATLNDDETAYTVLANTYNTQAAANFEKSIVGNVSNNGYTPRQMLLIARRVYAFINTNTDLAKEFKSILQDETTGDIVSKAKFSAGTKVIHRAYDSQAGAVTGDCMIVLGDKPFIMFIQYESVYTTVNNSWLAGYVNKVYNHVNGK